MATDHMDDSVKDEPHRLESGADLLGERMISSSVLPIIDDLEVDWCDSQHGSPTMPDVPMFGGGSISDQPAIELPGDVEAPDDHKITAAVPAFTCVSDDLSLSYYVNHPQVPPENTRQYKNYRCSQCGLATSGYLVSNSTNPAHNTCNDCGGSAFIVRITMPLPAENNRIP